MIKYDFDGKKVIVTGATGGIGSEIVRQFVEFGATVFISGTNKDRLDKLKNSFDKDVSGRIFAEECNLADSDAVSKLIATANETMGGLDILICNAGATNDKLSVRMTNDEFEESIKVNLIANFILCRDAMKLMMRSKYGRIVNISSVVGVVGNAGQVNYASAKAGLIGMTKTMAIECATRGVTVNAIAPGFVKTAMTEAIPSEIMSVMEKEIPMKRQGNTKEIASTVLFLSSEESSYITAATIHVSGGLTRV